MEISSTFWILDITDWWRQQEEIHSKYIDFSNVACDILSIIAHGVGVEASCSLGKIVIGWRLVKNHRRTLHELCCTAVGLSQQLQFGRRYQVSDTTNTKDDLKMKKEVEEMKLHKWQSP